MIYVTTERTVPRRPEVVWDIVLDVAALPAWADGVVEATLDAETVALGAKIDVVRRTRDEVVRATCEITAYRRHETLAVETRVEKLLLFDRLVLAPIAEGTQLTVYSELMFGDAFGELLARRRTATVERIYERSLDALVKRIKTVSEAPYR